MIFKTLQATLIVFPRYHRWLELLNNQMISNQYCEYISLHITQTALYTAAILNDFPSSQPYLLIFLPVPFVSFIDCVSISQKITIYSSESLSLMFASCSICWHLIYDLCIETFKP